MASMSGISAAEMRAIIFMKPEAASGLGHVGWAFETSPGKFWFGSVEYAGSGDPKTWNIPPGRPNGAFWEENASFRDVLQKMKSGKHGGNGWTYSTYKVVYVNDPDVAAAQRVARNTPKIGYRLFGVGSRGRNCMDATFDIIKAYARGNDTFLPWPSTHPVPNDWFKCICIRGGDADHGWASKTPRANAQNL
jgi:hypothetical protein